MVLQRGVLEAAQYASQALNGHHQSLWLGGGLASEVTYPFHSAVPADLEPAGTFYHLVQASISGVFRGAVTLYSRGATGASLVLSVSAESLPGEFGLHSRTANLVSGATAFGQVSGDFSTPVSVQAGDRLVLGFHWTTSGSGSAPRYGRSVTPNSVGAPYGHLAKFLPSTEPLSSFSYGSKPEAAYCPWIGLYK